MQITVILSNLVLANLLKFMPNISTLARIFTKVIATLEIIMDSKLTALLEFMTALLE